MVIDARLSSINAKPISHGSLECETITVLLTGKTCGFGDIYEHVAP